MSPAEREESLVWLNTVWGIYKSDVAKARDFDASVLQAYADQAPDALRRAGGDTAKMALDAGLVTSLKGRFAVVAVEQRLAQITGPDEDAHSFVGVDLDSYLANVESQRALAPGSRRKIGLIVAAGEIVPGTQPPGMVGSDTLAAQLREALFDESIKAVVLRIDSPGGGVFASEVIRREVQALRKAGKPVVASMSSLAASGGYYIAMDADRIVASPATLTGSIGVFAMVPTIQRSLERLGVHTDGVGTTALSGDLRLAARIRRFHCERCAGPQTAGRSDRRGGAGPGLGRRRREADWPRGRARWNRCRHQGGGEAREARRRFRSRAPRCRGQSW